MNTAFIIQKYIGCIQGGRLKICVDFPKTCKYFMLPNPKIYGESQQKNCMLQHDTKNLIGWSIPFKCVILHYDNIWS